MTSVDEKRAQRLKFMRMLYDLTGGHKFTPVNSQTIGDELQLSGLETNHLVEYLEDEGLAERMGMGTDQGGPVAITHKGIVEVEQAMTNPSAPTHHFPPAINVLNIGSMTDSQIIQGSPSASQQMTGISADAKAQLAAAVAELRARQIELQLPQEITDDLNAQLSTIEGQLRATKPLPAVLRAAGAAVVEILKSAHGREAAGQLLLKIPEWVQGAS